MKTATPRRYYVLMAASILWMAVIFYKSAESYQEQSLRPLLTDWLPATGLVKWLPKWEFTYDHDFVTWKDPQGMIEFFIRKAGHVTEYVILSLLLSYTFIAKNMKMSIALLSSSFISLLYAASDEWHQTWVSGRTGHAIDVSVDAIGILIALGWVVLSRSFDKSTKLGDTP